MRTMDDKERKALIKSMKVWIKKLKTSRKKKYLSRKFLMATGILTKGGNISSHYKHLTLTTTKSK